MHYEKNIEAPPQGLTAGILTALGVQVHQFQHFVRQFVG
jgi:hypothetical protein